MRVYVELPPGWGPEQVIIAAWLRAGYQVDEVRSLATGKRRMIVRAAGGRPRDPAEFLAAEVARNGGHESLGDLHLRELLGRDG
ncbi:hypothetical protein [Actinomadura sp. 9N215]|uniref:hypothetical protein n=1 Tax=Actinomadura sp. 9N215 TaxID=3375150 RepID=UPI0037BB6BA4